MGMLAKTMNTPTPLQLDLPIPSTCPYCGRQITPSLNYAAANVSDDGNRNSASAYWACNGCAGIFCAVYYLHKNSLSSAYTCSFKSLIPPILSHVEIDSRIAKLSPRFSDLFRQAEQAKSEGLIDLAGMGYRKALEVLLKDSLVSLERIDQATASRMSLVETIKAFDDNPRLIKVADQARVIGNEFTHYETRYEGYDIETLEKLIRIAIHWLSMEIETAELQPLLKKE